MGGEVVGGYAAVWCAFPSSDAVAAGGQRAGTGPSPVGHPLLAVDPHEDEQSLAAAP